MQNIYKIYSDCSKGRWSYDSMKLNWAVIPTKVCPNSSSILNDLSAIFDKMHALPKLLGPS